MERTKPDVYVNYSTAPDVTVWQHVVTQVLPPCVVSAKTQAVIGGGIQIRLVGEGEPLLKSAVKKGAKLTVAELVLLMKDNGIPEPAKGTGSGARGQVVKRDRVASVVRHFFPDADAEEQEKLVEGIAGPKSREDEIKECPEDILDFVAALDPDNAGAFKYVREVAQEAKDSRAPKQTKKDKNQDNQQPASTGDSGAAAAASSSRAPNAEKPKAAPVKPAVPLVAHEGSVKKWASHTPPELHHLLPGHHELPFVYLKVHGNRYQGVYQCGGLTLCLRSTCFPNGQVAEGCLCPKIHKHHLAE